MVSKFHSCLVHSFLCGRPQDQLQDVTSNPSFGFFPVYVGFYIALNTRSLQISYHLPRLSPLSQKYVPLRTCISKLILFKFLRKMMKILMKMTAMMTLILVNLHHLQDQLLILPSSKMIQ